MPKDSNIRASSREPRIMYANKWLSLDRKWNIFFLFAMSSCFIFSWYLWMYLNIVNISIFATVSSLIIVPTICTIFNETKFISKNRVLNSQGQIITKKQIPNGNALFWYALGNFMILWLQLSHAIMYVLILLSIFCGYFIFKNCPISYLFNPKTNKSKKDNYPQMISSSSSYDQNLDPARSHLPTNVYHYSHNRHRY